MQVAETTCRRRWWCWGVDVVVIEVLVLGGVGRGSDEGGVDRGGDGSDIVRV